MSFIGITTEWGLIYVTVQFYLDSKDDDGDDDYPYTDNHAAQVNPGVPDRELQAGTSPGPGKWEGERFRGYPTLMPCTEIRFT